MNGNELKFIFFTSLGTAILAVILWGYWTLSEPEHPLYVKGSHTELAKKEYDTNGIQKDQAPGWKNTIHGYDNNGKPIYAGDDPFLLYFWVFICIPIITFFTSAIIQILCLGGGNLLSKFIEFTFK
jgi:hypothetical protein